MSHAPSPRRTWLPLSPGGRSDGQRPRAVIHTWLFHGVHLQGWWAVSLWSDPSRRQRGPACTSAGSGPSCPRCRWAQPGRPGTLRAALAPAGRRVIRITAGTGEQGKTLGARRERRRQKAEGQGERGGGKGGALLFPWECGAGGTRLLLAPPTLQGSRPRCPQVRASELPDILPGGLPRPTAASQTKQKLVLGHEEVLICIVGESPCPPWE